MTIINPAIELTTEEVKAIDTVIELCDMMRNLNGYLLSMIFDDDCLDDNLAEIVNTLRDVLDNCEYEKSGGDE